MINLEKYNKDIEEVIWYVETNELPKELITMFKSSHKSLLKKIAEEEVERLERVKKEKPPLTDKTIDERMLISCYNEALQDQITHWKEIISKLD